MGGKAGVRVPEAVKVASKAFKGRSKRKKSMGSKVGGGASSAIKKRKERQEYYAALMED
jgi:hypothetical protein